MKLPEQAGTRFAKNLKRRRLDLGLSQDGLGRRAGLARSSIRVLETGSREPRLETLVKLSYGLEVEIVELLNGCGDGQDALERLLKGVGWRQDRSQPPPELGLPGEPPSSR